MELSKESDEYKLFAGLRGHGPSSAVVRHEYTTEKENHLRFFRFPQYSVVDREGIVIGRCS
jgi:hypothetical protein